MSNDIESAGPAEAQVMPDRAEITVRELIEILERAGPGLRVLVQIGREDFRDLAGPVVRTTGRLDRFVIFRPADAPADWA